MHYLPVAILRSLPTVMLLLEEDVQDDAIVYGSGNLKYFTCRVAHSKMVQPYTKTSITVASQSAGLSLIDSCNDMVKKHQSMVAWRTMDIFSRRPFEVYGANLLAKQIIFTKNTVVVHKSKALD